MVRRIVAVVIAMAFFIIPQSVFADITDCIKQHEQVCAYTNNYEEYMDAGLCQIWEKDYKGRRVLKIKYTATDREIDRYFEVMEYMKQKTRGMSDTDKIRLVNGYFQKNTKYGGGSTAVDSIVRGEANCEGYAFGFQMIADEIGLDSRLVVGGEIGELHEWNEVRLGGKWYGVDTCWGEVLKDPNGWEGHEKSFSVEL